MFGRAREETTAQEAPGTTIGSRHDLEYPLSPAPRPMLSRADIPWLRIQALLPISLE
jgi:hypothetical protein